MIKFFRKIRQRLLSENKFNKYVLYAIGEILLVVIGILIALQVNNWNEERRIADRRITLLENIRSDYLKNEIRLREARENSAMLNSNTLKFMDLISNAHETTPYDTLIKYGAGFVSTTTFSPLNSSYLTAQSTGDIGLIKDKELLELFIEFNESLDWLNFHVELSGNMVYTGGISEMREQLGSLYVIMDENKSDPHPKIFRMKEQEYRAFFREKKNFAKLESLYWINRNVLRSIDGMQNVNEEIITKIDTLLKK